MVKTPLSSAWIDEINSNKDIFIAIPSFNETLLLETIESAYTQAAHPERVYFGICNQKTENSFEDFSEFPNVRSLNIHYPYARGLGLAMLEAMMMWSGQKYFMRVDGHTVFNKDWDSLLIKEYDNLLTIADKPIISQRTDWFIFDGDGNKVFFDGHVNPIYFNNELIDVIRESKLAEFATPIQWDEKERFVEHYLISGHFIFSDWRFVDELLSDPRISFFGEEHVYGLRAYTNGFRIFGIRERIIHTLGKSEDFPQTTNGVADWRNSISEKASTFLHFYYSYKNCLSGLEFGYCDAKDENSYVDYINKIGFDYRKYYSEKGFFDGL